MEITLHPHEALEGVEQRGQQPDDRVDQAPVPTSATTSA
jgi:hypothetical protein